MKGILRLGYKLLVNDKAKFTALLLGITFAVYLMMFITSMFFGVLNHASATVINVGSTLWVMDPYVESVSNSVGMPDYVLDAVRSMQGVKYAVPLYSGGALVKLADGNYQAVTVIGLDDTSLLGRPELIEGKIEDIYAESGFIVVQDSEFSKLENPHIGSEFELNDNRAVIVGIAKVATSGRSAGFGNSSISSWFTWPSRFWSVGPSLAETIFDAGLRRATVQQYQANYDQTVANYRQTVLTAFQQVEDNLASLRILSQAIDQQNAAVEAAARNLQEATARYRGGVDPYLNVIVAQTTLLNDQQTAVNFRMQEMVASVQLIKALGGGWDAARIPSSKEIRTETQPDSNSTH